MKRNSLCMKNMYKNKKTSKQKNKTLILYTYKENLKMMSKT